jgi:AcrR family transcriptional regulator
VTWVLHCKDAPVEFVAIRTSTRDYVITFRVRYQRKKAVLQRIPLYLFCYVFIFFVKKNNFVRFCNYLYYVIERMTNQDDIIHQEILQVALRLYRKSGPKDVTMDNVAKATGRSRSSLYYYFKNRDEIFQAVLDRIARDVAAEIRLAVATADNLNDKIYSFCSTKVKTSQDWKRVFSAIDQLMDADEISKHFKMMDALHKKLIHLEREILVEAMSAAGPQPARILNNAELDLLAFIISGSIRGIRREIYDHSDPHDAKAAARLLSDMVTKWLEH